MREERALAAALARVLEGEEDGRGEVRQLALVLSRAAESAREEITDDEVEQALARARPRLASAARRPRTVPRLVLGGGLAAAIGAAALALVLTRGGGLDVSGKASAAVGPGVALHVVERIEPVKAGAFPVSIRSGWVDAAGHRAVWNQFVGGRRVAATLFENGRVSRYDPLRGVLVVAPSCRAFASGCAELVDPIDFYRRALQQERGTTSDTTYAGRRAFRLILRPHALPDAVRIEQVVTIDAVTYLPKLIVWREPGHAPFSRIVIRRVRTFRAQAVGGVFRLDLPPYVRVVERSASGRKLRLLGVRPLPVAAARRIVPPLLWLGRSYLGAPLRRLDEVKYNAGVAYRLRYARGITVWNYDAVVPPAVAAVRYQPAKVVPLPKGGVARFYFSPSGLAAELDRSGGETTILAPQEGKEDIFRIAEALRPLR